MNDMTAYKEALDWMQEFNDQFAKESERACVVLAAAMLDDALYFLLRAVLVPSPTAEDALLDSSLAPLATFGSRIDVAFRFGVISKRMCRDLHLIRRIRNDFAHNVSGCSFQATSVRGRVEELSRSSKSLLADATHVQIHGNKTRDMFQAVVGWMIFHLRTIAKELPAVREAQEEWAYNYSPGAKTGQGPPQKGKAGAA